MLCENCQRVLNVRKPGTKSKPLTAYPYWAKGIVKPFRHHESVDDFIAAVRRGCYLCDCLLREHGYRNIDTFTGQYEPPFSKVYIYYSGYDSFSLQVDFKIHGPSVELRHTVSLDSETSIKNFRGRGTLESNLDLAKSWFQNCDRNHQCQKLAVSTKLESFVPKRLVQIIPDSDSAGSTLWRVIDLEVDADFIKYGSVSHRWSTDMPKLTADSKNIIHEYQQDSLLPQNFRKVFTFAMHMGLSFLWLDCLCIEQDSEEDWQTQSLLMVDIYRHSSCNFLVSQTKDGSPVKPTFEFFRMDWKASRLSFVDMVKNPFKKFPIGTRVSGESLYWMSNHNFWQESVLNTELSTRGWIFQELYLSPVALHIYDENLYWDCLERRACDWCPEGVPPCMGSESTWLGIRDWANASLADRDVTEFEWHRTIEAYTASRVTFERDKLVAFAGIAKAFNAIVPDEYCAGLFKRHLPWDLAWSGGNYRNFDNTEYKQPERPKKYRAPSWSWASLDRRVVFPMPPIQGMVQLLVTMGDVSIESRTKDPFGQVESGRLELQNACLMLIKPQGHGGPRQLESYEALPVIEFNETVKIEVDVSEEDESQEQIFLPLYQYERSMGPEVAGLILEPITSERPFHCVRKGIVPRVSLDHLNIVDHHRRAETEVQSYVRRDSSGKYEWTLDDMKKYNVILL